MNSRKRWGLIIVLVTALIFATLPVTVRTISGNPSMIDSESYYNLRIGEELSRNPYMDQDPLQERKYNFNPLHYVIALFYMTNVKTNLIIIFSIIATLASAYFFYKTIEEKLSRRQAFLSLLIYTLSPLYSYMANSLTTHSITMLLITLSTYIYVKTKHKLSFLPASLTILTNPAAFAAFLLLGLVYLAYARERQGIILSLAIPGLLLFTIAKKMFNYVPLLNMSSELNLSNHITDFGALFGYPFFTLLIFIVGFAIFWNKNKNLRVANTLAVIAVLVSLYFPGARPVINMIISIYAAMTFEYFLERDWAVPLLKDLTLLLLFSSILFSAVSFSTRMVDMQPTQDMVESLQSIRFEDKPGAVLSTEENGYYIQYYTGKKTYVDDLSHIYEGYDEKKKVMKEIFESSTPQKTKKILDEEGISYIYTSKEMKEEIWHGTEQLMLVLELSPNFVDLSRDQTSWLYIKNQ